MSTNVVAARGYLADLLAGQAQPPAWAAPPTLAWLKALRAEATERVGVLRLPTLNDEAWRFTDIAALTGQSFQPLRTPTSLQAADVARFHIDEATTRLVFVDGVHAPDLSSTRRMRSRASGSSSTTSTRTPSSRAASEAETIPAS